MVVVRVVVVVVVEFDVAAAAAAAATAALTLLLIWLLLLLFRVVVLCLLFVVVLAKLQSDKQGNSRPDRAVICGRPSEQKESPVDWTRHEDVTRQATKAGSLLSTVFW